MLLIKNIRNVFWRIDPGSFELLHAFKTVLAILISLLLLNGESLITQLMAGVASGFSMQGVMAKTWKTRLRHVLVFDLIYFTCFALGLVVRESPYWVAITLVLLGFFVNYIRRFNLETSMAPMSAWTLCFLATILPFQTTTAAWNHIHGLVVGLVVSALVIIFVFPENYPRLFINNYNKFFQVLAQGLLELRRFILIKEKNNTQAIIETKKVLIQLANSNQLIHQANVFNLNEEVITNLVVHQYALLSSFTMLMDTYQTIADHSFEFANKTLVVFSRLHKRYAVVLQNLCLDANFTIQEAKPIPIQELSLRCEKITSVPPLFVVSLLNLKLAFDLLEKHIIQLIRNSE